MARQHIAKLSDFRFDEIPFSDSRAVLRRVEGIDNFYCCTVHSEIYIVHSPTNALFIKLGKV
jgi:hypothetical protein